MLLVCVRVGGFPVGTSAGSPDILRVFIFFLSLSKHIIGDYWDFVL
jgi:hypothetical protein